MTERERLINLLLEWGNKENDGVRAESIADYFIFNGVIVPPCKIGDTVYYLSRDCIRDDYILEVTVFGIVVNIYDDFKKICLKVTYEKIGGYIDMITAIYGVNAFSSREEAELKLKELKELRK